MLRRSRLIVRPRITSSPIASCSGTSRPAPPSRSLTSRWTSRRPSSSCASARTPCSSADRIASAKRAILPSAGRDSADRGWISMLLLNRPPAQRPSLTARDAEWLGRAGAERAAEFLAIRDPQPTPLQNCPAFEAELGISRLSVKDEGKRLGLGSFKALGGSYTVARLVVEDRLAQARTRICHVRSATGGGARYRADVDLRLRHGRQSRTLGRAGRRGRGRALG